MKALQVLSKNEDSKKLLRSLKRKNEDKDDKKLDKHDIPEKKRCTEGSVPSEQRINIVKSWVLEQFSPESITNLIMTFMVSVSQCSLLLELNRNSLLSIKFIPVPQVTPHPCTL